ncbi:hypothetical protein SNEBB_008784 [Seison nebaliae]|nr:hypothetical protein SNEBB_008784 [Seison nebaliae]
MITNRPIRNPGPPVPPKPLKIPNRIKLKNTYNCAKCHVESEANNDVINPSMLKVDNQYYHTTCLICSICQKVIGTSELTIQTLEINGDIKQRFSCQKCKSNLLEKCKRCNFSISGNYVKINEKYFYHVTCFTCCFCKKSLDSKDQQYICGEIDDLCCGRCFKLKVLKKCSICSELIDENQNNRIVVGNENYHPNCFRCRECNRQLIENTKTRIPNYSEDELAACSFKHHQQIYCQNCCKRRTTPQLSTKQTEL